MRPATGVVITRADVVGSLLRPPELTLVRQSVKNGTAAELELRLAEDIAVRDAVAMQESAGVDVVSDGEMRRGSWIASVPFADLPTYTAPAAGYALLEVPQTWVRGWRDTAGRPVDRPVRPRPIITERLRPQRDIVADEYGFLKRQTHSRAKYTFPAPSYHRVFWHPDYSSAAYPTVDDFLQDVCRYIREQIVQRAIELGCDYVQMDAPNYGQFYTDPDIRAQFEAEGHDLSANLVTDVEIDDAVFDGIDVATRALHVCRGNGAGGVWSAAGGYDILAPVMFPRLHNVNTLLLEYDTPRAGDFSPLRHVPASTTVVLGLVTTKLGVLEQAATVEQRIHEASAMVPLERLAVSPQCGFNSAGAGNPLTPAEQEAKLRLVAQLARHLWPT